MKMTENTDNQPDPQSQMEALFERMTDSYTTAVEQNIDAQSALLESWSETVEEAFSEEHLEEGYEGTMRAYEIWMEAAEDSLEQLAGALEGEDVEPETFRDIWLRASNRAFKEVMGTTAFAAAIGQTTDEALDLRQEFDRAAEETLHTYGFATTGDVREVGDRLVELERRQHAIEKKLDRLIESQEGSDE